MLRTAPLVLLLPACCPNERDQVQVAVTVEGWSALAFDCGGGCGAALTWAFTPESGGPPTDTETVQVSFAAGVDAPTLALAFAQDTDVYSFPEAYDKAAFTLHVASPAGLSADLGPVEARPSSIAPPDDAALSGDACNVVEVVAFDVTLDAGDAYVYGRDTGG